MHRKYIHRTALEKFRAFCKHCTLHGFYYFSERRHWLIYVTWTAIILASLSLCAFLCQMIWQKFAEDPTFTVVESTHYSTAHVQFPAVTLCDSEKVYGPNTFNITNILHHRNFNDSQIEEFYKSFSSIQNSKYSPPEFVKKMHRVLNDLGYNFDVLLEILAKPCEVLLVECTWRSEKHNCSEMFRQVYSTISGYCCQFDMEYFKTQTNPRTDFDFGKEQSEALGIVVNGQKVSFNDTVIDGFVLLYVSNENNRLTIVDNPITLTPSGFFDVNIYIWVIDSSRDVKSLSLSNRKCLLDTDIIDTGSFYQECMSVLILRRVVDYCRCLPFRYTAQKLQVDDYPHCTWERLYCIYQTIAKEKSSIRDILSENECLQNCDYVQYETEIDYINNQRIIENKNDGYSSVSVHFASNTCFKYRREVLYAWDQMIANLGGIFGLCLGGSLISLIELSWFIVDFFLTLLGSIRNNKTGNSKKKQVFTVTNDLVTNKRREGKTVGRYPFVN